MGNAIIGIGDLSIAYAPDTLTTLGLGSCIGLVLYDRFKKIGGMAHIMLPTAPAGASVKHKAKYADIGFQELLKNMITAGANPRLLTAKMVGGAHMFSSSTGNDIMKVGQRNIEICRLLLQKHSISIIAEETGGTTGRTIRLDCETGLLHVRTAWPQKEWAI